MLRIRSGLIGLTLTSALALASSANAADIYAKNAGGYKDAPIYVANSWTGFYLGLNAGYGWSASGTQDIDVEFQGQTLGPLPNLGPEPDGVFAGGQIGYNFGMGNGLVVGIEADLQGSGINDKYTYLVLANIDSSLDYFGTVRGRIGYAFDRTLVYFTGGFAYGGVDTDVRLAGAVSIGRHDDTLTGYVLGGGVEHKFSPNWSMKVEYQYVDLGSYDVQGKQFSVLGFPVDLTEGRLKNIDADFHTIRVGLNYHVNREYEPLK